MMALLTFARRLQRTHLQLFLPRPLSSITHPFISSSSSSSFSLHTAHYFIQPFHQTHIVPSYRLQHSPYFSIRSSHNQIIDEPFDFNEYTGEAHQHSEPDILEFIRLLKSAKNFVSEIEAFAFLDDSGFQPNKKLVYSTIWAFRDEWKLAFLVFKWGEKWSCGNEKNSGLMIWVLGNHKKFNTAWCLIRDLHRSAVDIRQAMLIMIDRYAAANDPGKAIQTFQTMEKFRMTPDQKVFYTLLNVLCKHGNIEEAEEFMLLNKKLFPLETEGFNIILNGWCNISLDVYEAKRIWREMSKCCIVPNATSYTHMISCFSKIGNLFDSVRLYDEMKKRGWVPGREVYNSLIYILARENCLKEALKILDRMKEAGVQPDSTTFNSMICPLCDATKLDEARTILATMIGENVTPTIETYHAFLEGGSLEGTLEILNCMKKAGLCPNRDTFLLIFRNLFKLDQPENALKIWGEMKQYEVVPDSEHYAVMVERLAMCGLLIKARELYAVMRSNGILDNPKLKKILKEPVQGSSHQREQRLVRVVRRIKSGTQSTSWESNLMRRKNHGNLRSKKTSSET